VELCGDRVSAFGWDDGTRNGLNETSIADNVIGRQICDGVVRAGDSDADTMSLIDTINRDGREDGIGGSRAREDDKGQQSLGLHIR